MRQKRIAIFGSCISRDPFTFEPDDGFVVETYIARNSMAGLYTPPLDFDPDWYAQARKFERDCLVHDFRKDVVARLCAAPADLLLIDLIDERFDLIRIGETLLSRTGHVATEGFLARYGARMEVLPRLDAVAMVLWEQGCRRFLHEIAAVYPPERIILVAGGWAAEFRSAEGVVTPFAAPYDRLIPLHNARLAQMFAVIRDACPGIRVFSPMAGADYADPLHRWSKEPFHYVPAYYRDFVDWMRNLA